MPVFPSLEWGTALSASLNSNPEFKEAAGSWDGTILLSCLAEEGKLGEDLHFLVDPSHGNVKEIKQVSSPEEANATYTLAAKYTVWKEILQGKYDAPDAIKKGRIKLKGNLFKLMMNVKAPKIMINAMRDMPTQFVDEINASQN